MISWLREIVRIATRRHPIFERQNESEGDGSVVTFRAHGRRDPRGRVLVSWIAPRALAVLAVFFLVLAIVAIVALAEVLIDALPPRSAPVHAARPPALTMPSTTSPATTTLTPTTSVIVTTPVAPPEPDPDETSRATTPTTVAGETPLPVGADIGAGVDVSVGLDEETIEANADVVLDLPLLNIELDLGIRLANLLGPPPIGGETP